MTAVGDGSREGSAAACSVCGQPLQDPRARSCSRACQQRAYRLRRAPAPPDLTRLRADLRRRAVLRAHTLYECPQCETRRVGEQRCPDCRVFCRALGLGGTCPDCETPLLLSDLLDMEVLDA